MPPVLSGETAYLLSLALLTLFALGLSRGRPSWLLFAGACVIAAAIWGAIHKLAP